MLRQELLIIDMQACIHISRVSFNENRRTDQTE